MANARQGQPKRGEARLRPGFPHGALSLDARELPILVLPYQYLAFSSDGGLPN
jgi:hypothetical protein